VSKIYPQDFWGGFRAKAYAIPDLALWIFGSAKEMRFLAVLINLKDQRRAWLLKSAEVEKITVVAIRKFTIAIAR
jgi:hypothetical protein